jgi:uncharacterized protein
VECDDTGGAATMPVMLEPPVRATLDWNAEGEDDLLPPASWGRREPGGVAPALWGFAVVVAVLAAGQVWLAPAVRAVALQTWATVFVAIVMQALPFLVLGVALSAAITVFVPAGFWVRALPSHPAAAVPVAGAAGAVLPGCECASVPVSAGLMARGVTPAAALAFLLASPAINPVVLVSTAVAFPGRPEMVAARFAASLGVAVLAGWVWARFGRTDWLRLPPRRDGVSGGRWAAFADAMHHDLLHAGGYLVVGALAAATMNAVVPREWMTGIAGVPWLSVLVLAALAVLLSICSEADAFVAASMTGFSPTAKLAFLVVGPMVDLKLIALQTGTFGRAFAVRFVPLTFTLAIVVSVLVGGILL